MVSIPFTHMNFVLQGSDEGLHYGTFNCKTETGVP